MGMVGGLLIEAKALLRHGQWLPRLQREFGYSPQTAQNYMRAHEVAGDRKNLSDLTLTPTALYRVADADRLGGRHSSARTREQFSARIASGIIA